MPAVLLSLFLPEQAAPDIFFTLNIPAWLEPLFPAPATVLVQKKDVPEVPALIAGFYGFFNSRHDSFTFGN
jgi:hypothetical protein